MRARGCCCVRIEAMNVPNHAPEADPALREALAQDLDRLAEGLVALPGVEAVLLMGSAARGELAMLRLGDRPIYFGDFELMLISPRRLPAPVRRQALDFCARYQASLDQPSPRFHIDLAFRERSRLAQLPPIVFAHELLACGRVLRGPAVLAGLPQLRASQLDLANTREILFKRLWALAEGWPEGQGAGAVGPEAGSSGPEASTAGPDAGASEIAERSLGALLWRQPLDLTTVLLPAVGILEPGYARRVEIWRRHPELPFRPLVDRALGMDSGAWLGECLRRRLACEAAEDPALEHRRALLGLAAGLAWGLQTLGPSAGLGISGSPDDLSVLEIVGPNGDSEPMARIEDPAWIASLAEALPARSGRLFNERPISRGEWLALARQSVRFSYTIGPRAAWRWLRAPRKGHLAAGLLHLHLALAEEMAGRPQSAARDLERARWHALRSAPDAFVGRASTMAPERALASEAAEPKRRAAQDPTERAEVPQSSAKATVADSLPSRDWLACREALGRAFWRNIRLGAPAVEPNSTRRSPTR